MENIVRTTLPMDTEQNKKSPKKKVLTQNQPCTGSDPGRRPSRFE
jgi:hypothetical protein